MNTADGLVRAYQSSSGKYQKCFSNQKYSLPLITTIMGDKTNHVQTIHTVRTRFTVTTNHTARTKFTATTNHTARTKFTANTK